MASLYRDVRVLSVLEGLRNRSRAESTEIMTDTAGASELSLAFSAGIPVLHAWRWCFGFLANYDDADYGDDIARGQSDPRK